MKWVLRSGLAVVLALGLATVGSAKTLGHASQAKDGQAAQAATGIAVPAGFTARLFATAPSGLTNPDDITRLDGHIFVAFQNNANADGTPVGAQSTVVEFASDGSVLNQWNLTGRCDGLTADPESDQLLATINEDANSSFAVIRPHASPADQIRLLSYSPDPGNVSGEGGTDAITILDGAIYVSASNPSLTTVPAVYRLRISGHDSTAFLQPVFFDNSQAMLGNAGTSGMTMLNLSDPDSNAAVPSSSPRFAHELLLVSQADSQLVFASNPDTPRQALTLLNLGGPQVDDVRWADTSGGDLFVVDQQADQIWVISGPFPAGTAYASIPSDSLQLPGNVGLVDLNTGSVVPFASGLLSPKGLLYLGRGDNQDEQQQGDQGQQGNGGEGQQGNGDQQGENNSTRR
jgi:hypothetical protein